MLSTRPITKIELIKQQFGTLYSTHQQKRKNLLQQTFYLSNDQVTYRDIPKSIRDIHQLQVTKCLEKHKNLNPVNLMVADGDYLSWSMEGIPGDIIILDNSEKLLQHIEERHQFLLDQYEDYQAKKCNFAEVKDNLQDLLFKVDEHLPDFFNNRMSAIGPSHWLYNEENYKRCMQGILKRKLVTLNIDLFNLNEINSFGNLLEKYDCIVTYLNLTNLPDYDTQDTLSKLITVLPVAEEKQACLYQWNIHDHGFNASLYDHYLWFSHTVSDYKRCFDTVMPAYFASKDFYDFLLEKIQIDGAMRALKSHGFYRWYVSYLKFTNKSVHCIVQQQFKSQYFIELKKLEEEFKDFCVQPEHLKQEIEVLIEAFAKHIKPRINSQMVLNIGKDHWEYLQQIAQEAQMNNVVLSPIFFDVLKLNFTLTTSIFEISSSYSFNDQSIRLIEAVFFATILQMLHPKKITAKAESIKNRLVTYLTDSKGEARFDLIKAGIAELSLPAQINMLKGLLGPIAQVKRSRQAQQTFFSDPLPSTIKKVDDEKQEAGWQCAIM